MSDPQSLMLFSLILMRMSGMILLNPIIGRRNIPTMVKSGFILMISIIAYLSVAGTSVPIAESVVEYAILLLKEFFTGYIIGTVLNMFFYVIIFAGDFMDLQLGISMAKIYDSQSNASIAITATFYNALLILLFFAVDGHLALIKIILTSSDIVPYGNVIINTINLPNAILDIFIQCTSLGLKFAFPLFAFEFLAEIGVGILMKTIPQINVFVINMQIKLFVGLIILIIMFTPMSDFIEKLITDMLNMVERILIFMT